MHRDRHRRAPRQLLAAIVGLLTPALLVAGPAAADPAPDSVAAAAALTEDHSKQLPRTRHNEVTGDFLRRGYDQRMVAESGNLVIYDSDARGGTPLRSTPTDLQTDGGDFEYRAWFGPWAQVAKDNIGAISLAWTPDGLYMAGRSPASDHRLYKLPADGSCAQQSCAEWVTSLPAYVAHRDCLTCPGGWAATTSSLAAGTIGTTPVLAVGLTTTRDLYDSEALWAQGDSERPAGIYLVDPTNGNVLNTYSADLPSSGAQTMVTALDWDDNGSGLLAIGVADGQTVHAVRVSADGFTVSNHTKWDVPPPPSFPYPIALSVAVGHRADGSPVFAYGMSDGGVKLWDPAVTSTTLLSQFTGTGDAVDAVTFTDRIDGTVGVPDLVAVSNRDNSARVLRYSGATTLTPLAVAPQGGTTTDVGGIRAWFPGYKTGTLTFANFDSESDIQLDFATRPNAAYGCWFLQGPPPAGVFDPPPGLPTTPVVLDKLSSAGEPGLLSSSTATLTAGEGGDCAATDFTGQWAAYVVATPASRPADRTVAKLVWSRSGQLAVQSVGGALTLQPVRLSDELALGSWSINIQSPQPPGAPTSIKMTGKRLDPAGTDRPVYRFDVAAATWPLPVSTPPRIETVLPPLQVRGVTSGGTDVPLGLLVPQGKPARATSGSVTLSPVSFYWQNPSTGQQITDVYVQADGATSTRVNLAGLAAPAVGTTVSAVVVCPATGSQTCDADADPVANGLDQAPLRIQVSDANGVLPLTDPVYGQVYYRDQDGDLLTGLIPADGSSYIRVSPYAGAYPNDGSTSSTTRPPTGGTVGGRFGYLSTTTTVEQEVTAHVGGSNFASAPIIVDAINLTPQVQPGAQAGPGFYVNGCAGDYTGTNFCRLAQITSTAPGLFLTSDPGTSELRIGLQFATTALTSLTSLPLEQVAGQPEHTVAAQPLVINNGEVSLTTTSGFQPADLIDTWLVTHGTQLRVRAVKVGGGN
jgi:hypothetical protein